MTVTPRLHTRVVESEVPTPAPDPASLSVSSVQFAEAARLLGESARQCGYTAPAFRSPPRVPGARRTIQRRGDGTVAVAVSLRGRVHGVVVADVIDGIVVANELQGPEASALRDSLWESAGTLLTRRRSATDALYVESRLRHAA